MTAIMFTVKSLNRMSQDWDNSTVSAVHMLICRRIAGEAGSTTHDVRYMMPWPPGLSPGVSNRLLAYTPQYIFVKSA